MKPNILPRLFSAKNLSLIQKIELLELSNLHPHFVEV